MQANRAAACLGSLNVQLLHALDWALPAWSLKATHSLPQAPVLVITDSRAVARAVAPFYAAVPYLVDALPAARRDLEVNT